MTKSLDKFKARYYEHKDRPTVIAFTMKGIYKGKNGYSKEILDFAKTHHVTIRAGNAYYPANQKLRREPTKWTTSGKKKEYRGRGY